MSDQKVDENITVEEIADSFIRSLEERGQEEVFSVWLGNKLRQEMPEMSQEAGEQMAVEIIDAVAAYDQTVEAVNAAEAAGQSKEEWLAGHLAGIYVDMSVEEAGEKLNRVENDLAKENVQLIRTLEDETIIVGDAEVIDAASVEWNEYNLKQKAYDIGQQVILNGMSIAANVLQAKVQDNDADLGGIVKDALKDGLEKKDEREVKAVVAGAIKVAAEKGIGDAVPEDTPIEVIGAMAGQMVDATNALWDMAKGECTALETTDRIGKAAVAAGGHYIRFVVEGKLARVPYVGPVLVDLAGGMLEHFESPQFAEDVYNTIKNMVAATWEGIKKSRTVQCVNKVVQKAKNLLS
jgi:hypothetical protein